MPLALEVLLKPIRNANIPVSNGLMAYSSFLEAMARVDQAMAASLHDSEVLKPFTVSPIAQSTGARRAEVALDASLTYRWRVTALTAEVARCVRSAIYPSLAIRIGQAELVVTGTDTNGRDGGATEYERIASRWRSASTPDTITLEFVTPTTFREGRLEKPFPLPSLVFGRSLAERWNLYSTEAIPDLGTSLDGHLILSNWCGETRRVLAGKWQATGFVGKFTYRFSRSASDEVRRSVCSLAEYSFYSGVGWMTSQGMGQVRPTFGRASSCG